MHDTYLKYLQAIFEPTCEPDFDFSAAAQDLRNAVKTPDSVGIAISETISGHTLITASLVAVLEAYELS